MRRTFLCALVASALALPAGANAAGFTLGVAAGEMRTTSAILWARAPAGRVTLELSRRRVGGFVRQTTPVVRTGDGTVRATPTGLRPGTVYFYRFRAGRQLSPAGRFRTAPAATSTATVRFGYTGDADATPVNGAPAFNRFGVYASMARERNDFNINLGDTIYSDSEVGGSPVARTVQEKWAKYRLGLALPALRSVRAATGLFSHWDDHEFVNDFSRPEFGDALYAAGVRAFTDYAPVRPTAADGLYRSVRWGRNLELFFLDERSFRDAKASAGGTCDNPATPGRPDLAPTAPPSLRAGFAQLAPPLAAPVSPACLARIRDPGRTMLGTRQRDRFLAAVAASGATFKVIVNEVPIQQLYALPYDRWEGYEAERTALLEALRRIPNVVFLTTDTHATLVGDVRLRTFEAPGPLETGILEAVTGPVATNTYARELDATLGTTGTGPLLESLLFKPAPPRGLGLRCAVTNAYSYAQVRVTSEALTITPQDESGKLLRELNGNPCGPFTIPAR
jgi:alkaline phosphatase D